jgi:hypothetical protein
VEPVLDPQLAAALALAVFEALANAIIAVRVVLCAEAIAFRFARLCRRRPRIRDDEH